MSQPRGFVRDAIRRPLRAAASTRLLDGVLALLELAVATDEHAEDLRRQLAQQVLGRRVMSLHHTSSWPLENITGRTSMPMPSTLASGIIAASSIGPLDAVAVDQVEAAEVLLGLEVRAVRDDRLAAADPDDARSARDRPGPGS